MKKNYGFTLVELIIVISLISLTSFFIITNYNRSINRARSYNIKNKIINTMNYLQKKSNVDEKMYEIVFNLDNNKIDYIGNTLKLDDRFIYETNNVEHNFTRKVTKKGNLDRGFTIIIKDKKSKKIYDRLSYNTTNGLNIAVLSNES